MAAKASNNGLMGEMRKPAAEVADYDGLDFENLASQARFELTTFPLGGGCSIQLSYWDEENCGRAS